MNKFIIIEHGEAYNFSYTHCREVICKEMNIGVRFEYDVDVCAWDRGIIKNIENYHIPDEMDPGDDYGTYIIVSDINLSDEATNNFIANIYNVAIEEDKRRIEYIPKPIEIDELPF